MRNLAEEDAKRKKNRTFYERRSSVMSDSNSRQPSPEPERNDRNATDAATTATNPTFAPQPTASQPFKTSAAISLTYIPGPAPTIIPESAPFIIPVPPPSGYAKEIGNLEKLYKNDMKYERNDDHFVHKLSIFHHLCSKADVPHEAKSKAFSSMLRDHALNYYLANINMLKNASLDQACTFISTHFENPDYRKNNLTK